MRAALPAFLIHSILVLSADIPLETSQHEPHATSSNEVITTPLTLWDLGFSLKERWADLREQEECPVPPDLICVDGDAECGDQQVLETVASALHLSDTGVAQPEPDAPTGDESAKDELEDDLVSFEDWKRKKLEREEDVDEGMSGPISTWETAKETPARTESEFQAASSGQVGGPTDAAAAQKKPDSSSSDRNDTHTSVSKSAGEVGESPKPHVHNKYNYASPDCSARIHSSSPSTQHASSLLHKSRDRYMLTPCKADEHWVVVELCDEIRIEAIEIAVWEFFSGVIRDVRVSVGGAEDDDESGDEEEDDAASGEARRNNWEEVGSFVGKNVRGVQTFTLPQPTSFHRFIRLDFPSFYGTEYYCPVSQVKVYGMNQMEAFKWEQKRLAASAKDRDREKTTKERDAEERRLREKAEADERLREQIRREDEKREKELDELEKLVVQQAKLADSSPDLTSLPKDLPTIEIVTVTAPSSSSSLSSASPKPSSAGGGSNESVVTSSNETAQETPIANGNLSASPITSMTISASSSQKSPAARSDSSESIYAQIVRRLNALEGNSSLVARYIEEQAKVMRLMLGRVERGWEDWRLEREQEELARWEQERMRQEDRLGAVISQMEQQRLAIDSERRAILAEIRLLSEELGHERRRGIAQLVIILTILVIGAATRSSAIDAVLRPLVVEARRRRSVYKSFSGPLAGLAIDMGSDRPPAIIGQPRTSGPNANANAYGNANSNSKLRDPNVDASATPGPNGMGKPAYSSSVRRSDSGRRPLTPRRRQATGNSFPQTRVVSDGTPLLHDSASSPFLFGLKSPKARGSLPPPRAHGLPRKLARSAHLHTIEADRVRRDVKARVEEAGPDIDVDMRNGEITPRRPQSTQLVPRTRTEEKRDLISPSSGDLAVFSDSPETSTDVEQRSDWDTDAEGAVSDVDGDLHPGDQEVVKELLDIWSSDDRPSASPSSGGIKFKTTKLPHV